MKSRSKNGLKWKQSQQLMEELIGVLDIWDDPGRKVSCKVLEILEDASHLKEIRSCKIWQNQDGIRKGPIVFTLLKVEDCISDDVFDFLGAHGTTHSR